MDLSRALLVVKPTKVEFDMQRLGVTAEALSSIYHPDDRPVIFESHERQLRARRRARELLPEAAVVERERLTREEAAEASLVIALGGDNHFIFVSHFLRATPILGINADPVRSHGGLLQLDESKLEAAVSRIREGEFSIRAWTRIDGTVDGRAVGTATGEFFVGESHRVMMTRHVLQKDDGPQEEHKSSGLLLVTGAGSTGWFGHYEEPFERDLRVAKWRLTEPFPFDHKYRWAAGELEPGGVLRVRSKNDDRGIVAVDSLGEEPFPYGAVAEFRISSWPLRVLV
jgi:NAD kinase